MSGSSYIVDRSQIDVTQQQQLTAQQQEVQDVDAQYTSANLCRQKRVGKNQLTKAKLFLTVNYARQMLMRARGKLQSEHIANFKRWVALGKKDENLNSLQEWLASIIKYRTEVREEASGFSSTLSSRSPNGYKTNNNSTHRFRNNDDNR
ncbi:hypothetical protein LOTGIDRAFT_162834 [Lottia gigantea]|uniref:Uncharacterized protein n=1 Tax=Lottia gigantea TaxID=225164 RepID=V3ZLC6_LOTGI|nr:hypothetical protein LOTGIDRAFT_162834 [Lottia gigantea]ESO92178.1 hypothetical protein LOTGIDRAFT_162834 [Lottia gigantea]